MWGEAFGGGFEVGGGGWDPPPPKLGGCGAEEVTSGLEPGGLGEEGSGMRDGGCGLPWRRRLDRDAGMGSGDGGHLGGPLLVSTPPQCRDAPQPPVVAVSTAWPPAAPWGAAGWGHCAPISPPALPAAPPSSCRDLCTPYLLYRSPPSDSPPPSLPCPSRCSPSPPPFISSLLRSTSAWAGLFPSASPWPAAEGKTITARTAGRKGAFVRPSGPCAMRGSGGRPVGSHGDVGTEGRARSPAGLGWGRDGWSSVHV